MEVSPEYWENPESLKDIYVSTSGGAISGAQATAGVVTSARRRSQTPKTAALTGVGATQLDPSQAVRNQRTNAIAGQRPRLRLDRRRASARRRRR